MIGRLIVAFAISALIIAASYPTIITGSNTEIDDAFLPHVAVDLVLACTETQTIETPDYTAIIPAPDGLEASLTISAANPYDQPVTIEEIMPTTIPYAKPYPINLTLGPDEIINTTIPYTWDLERVVATLRAEPGDYILLDESGNIINKIPGRVALLPDPDAHRLPGDPCPYGAVQDSIELNGTVLTTYVSDPGCSGLYSTSVDFDEERFIVVSYYPLSYPGPKTGVFALFITDTDYGTYPIVVTAEGRLYYGPVWGGYLLPDPLHLTVNIRHDMYFATIEVQSDSSVRTVRAPLLYDRSLFLPDFPIDIFVGHTFPAVDVPASGPSVTVISEYGARANVIGLYNVYWYMFFDYYIAETYWPPFIGALAIKLGEWDKSLALEGVGQIYTSSSFNRLSTNYRVVIADLPYFTTTSTFTFRFTNGEWYRIELLPPSFYANIYNTPKVPVQDYVFFVRTDGITLRYGSKLLRDNDGVDIIFRAIEYAYGDDKRLWVVIPILIHPHAAPADWAVVTAPTTATPRATFYDLRDVGNGYTFRPPYLGKYFSYVVEGLEKVETVFQTYAVYTSPRITIAGIPEGTVLLVASPSGAVAEIDPNGTVVEFDVRDYFTSYDITEAVKAGGFMITVKSADDVRAKYPTSYAVRVTGEGLDAWIPVTATMTIECPGLGVAVDSESGVAYTVTATYRGVWGVEFEPVGEIGLFGTVSVVLNDGYAEISTKDGVYTMPAPAIITLFPDGKVSAINGPVLAEFEEVKSVTVSGTRWYLTPKIGT